VETVEAAETAAARLGEAAALALAFSAASGGEAANQMAQLEEEATAGLALMESIEARIGEALEVLGQAGPDVASLLGGASGEFADHQDISQALSDTHLRLIALGQGQSHRAEPNSSAAALLQTIRKSYTMDVERRIHDAKLGRPAGTAEAPSAERGIVDLDLFEAARPTQTEVNSALAATEPPGSVEGEVLFFLARQPGSGPLARRRPDAEPAAGIQCPRDRMELIASICRDSSCPAAANRRRLD
jgi:hypothetical protein